MVEKPAYRDVGDLEVQGTTAYIKGKPNSSA